MSLHGTVTLAAENRRELATGAGLLIAIVAFGPDGNLYLADGGPGGS